MQKLVINMRNETEIKHSDLRKKQEAQDESKEESEAKQQLFNFMGVLPEQRSLGLIDSWTSWFGGD